MESANKTNELKYLFSLYPSYTKIALRYSGFGIGINYEHKLTNFLSIKLGFGQMFCFSEITILTIDQQLYYYLLGKGLNKLYIGLGHGGNLFLYPNYTNEDNASVYAAISITPVEEWKWKILNYFITSVV
jgi:hypothetical protein